MSSKPSHWPSLPPEQRSGSLGHPFRLTTGPRSLPSTTAGDVAIEALAEVISRSSLGNRASCRYAGSNPPSSPRHCTHLDTCGPPSSAQTEINCRPCARCSKPWVKRRYSPSMSLRFRLRPTSKPSRNYAPASSFKGSGGLVANPSPLRSAHVTSDLEERLIAGSPREEVILTYRRRHNSDTWHWCSNCSDWPESDYSTHSGSKPTSGELCNQCEGKQKAGNCTSS